jgi:hypothetical protein
VSVEDPYRVSRRRFLAGLAIAPFAITIACAGDELAEQATLGLVDAEDPPTPVPTPTSTPEPPFVVAEGLERRTLMEGTPEATPLYIYGSGRPGNVLMVLGGVHGNEPGGWLAADRLADGFRPENGAFLIVPRANRLSTIDFVRTTDALGDLNRLYPGDPDGLPMARMANEIVQTAREFHVSYLVDMHESWAFYKDRPQNGTAFLGQTIATDPNSPGGDLARAVVEAQNSRMLYNWEEFFYRERGGNANNLANQGFNGSVAPSNQTPGNPSGRGSSSLGLPNHVPTLNAALLVEMGQQQTLERRTAMHVDIVREVARRIAVTNV